MITYNDYDKRKFDELKTLRITFGTIIDGIKNRQWLCLYYSFLLQAGIIGFYKLVHIENTNFNTSFLSIVSILISIITTVVLLKYQTDIFKNRYIVEAIISPNFTEEAKKCIKVREVSEEFPYSIKDFLEFFIIIFNLFIWSSCAFVLYYLKTFYNFKLLLNTSMIFLITIFMILLIITISYLFIINNAKKNHKKQ